MASIQAGKNTFRVRVCVGRDERTGKQVWRTTTFQNPEGMTPKAAERERRRIADEWERKQRADYAAGLDQHRDRITLKAFTWEHWFTNSVEAAGLAYNTLISYRKLAGGVLEYFGERIRLVEITPERIGGFIRWGRTDKGFSDRTVRMHFDALRAILAYAVACGYLDKSPVDSMRPQDKPTVRIQEPDFLKPDEARDFLDALDGDSMPELWKAYFQLLLFAGVRRSEGLALTWADYDSERKELVISKSVTLTGERKAETVVKSTKTGRRRAVPVSETLAGALEARRAEMAAWYGDVKPEWFIFGEVTNPEKPQNPNRVYQHLRRFQDRHGLRRTSVHLLRHSFASLALGSGADLKAIQRTLGHSRPSMTLQYYAGVAEQQTRAAVDGVERTLRRGSDEKKPVPGDSRNEPCANDSKPE